MRSAYEDASDLDGKPQKAAGPAPSDPSQVRRQDAERIEAPGQGNNRTEVPLVGGEYLVRALR
jgi:hypothetical protein